MFDVYNYPNQTDLVPVAIGFVGALIGGLLSYLGTKQVYKNQLKNERKIVAKALDIDLKNISESVDFIACHSYYKEDSDFNIKTSKHIILAGELENKLFNDKNLLYSIFNHDIAKLDYELSSEIYEFYDGLFKAEELRAFVLRNLNSNVVVKELADLENEVIKTRYNLIRILIIRCGDTIPELRKKLEKTYNS